MAIKLNPEDMAEGAGNFLRDQVESGMNDRHLNDPDVEAALGKSLTEKNLEGWQLVGIIIRPYAPLFLSSESSYIKERQKLEDEFGGQGKFEYYLCVRTGEVFVLRKNLQSS